MTLPRLRAFCPDRKKFIPIKWLEFRDRFGECRTRVILDTMGVKYKTPLIYMQSMPFVFKDQPLIFDGDIIKLTKCDGECVDYEFMVIVKFVGLSWVGFRNNVGRYDIDLSKHTDCKITLMGNIYENLELLEQIK